MKRGLDKLSKEHRSWNMSRIHGKDTKPELIVRRLLHKMGYRFRLHVRIPIEVGRSCRFAVTSKAAQQRRLTLRFVRPDIVGSIDKLARQLEKTLPPYATK